jgi:glyoxylate/hydroxypyruvate reductase A
LSRSPIILVYSRSPKIFDDWLTAHDCPGTVLTASRPDEAAAVIDRVEVILASRFPAELLARAPQLRWVQSLGAGVDELVGSLAPDIVISLFVGQFGGYMAEYVFAELLASTRGLERVRAAQRERRWDHFVANTLQGQTLGVAGLGSIGTEIVRKGRAFDMRVYGLSRSGTAADRVDRHFTPDNWTDFVRDLDVLVLALPRTPATERVVDAKVLGAMRPEAVLINVGRGTLVDENALIQALRQKRLAGAILDVFQTEPLPAFSPLWDLPGVRVSPHLAGPSTAEGVGSFFLSNLHLYLRGESLAGIVDRSRGY